MSLFPDKGAVYNTLDVQRIMPYECGKNQIWAPFDGGTEYEATWSTTDELILATLYHDGHIQFAYSQWLKAQGLLTTPEFGPAPVEPIIQKLNNDGTVPNA